MAFQATLERQIVRPVTPRDRTAVMEDVVKHFAYVSGRSPDEIRSEIALIGNGMVVTDKEAKAIFAHLEAQYHCEGIFSVTDLCPSQDADVNAPSGSRPPRRRGCGDPAEDTSVGGLVDIVMSKLGV